MQPLNPLGEFKRLLSLFNDGVNIELVRYINGGLGILQEGRDVGFWSDSAEDECVKAFYELGAFQEKACIIMTRKTFETTNSLVANANQN